MGIVFEVISTVFEVLFDGVYERVGKVLYGPQFAENRKAYSLMKRIVAAILALALQIAVLIALFFALAYIFNYFDSSGA